jgi:hypothetical protein
LLAFFAQVNHFHGQILECQNLYEIFSKVVAMVFIGYLYQHMHRFLLTNTLPHIKRLCLGMRQVNLCLKAMISLTYQESDSCLLIFMIKVITMIFV